MGGGPTYLEQKPVDWDLVHLQTAVAAGAVGAASVTEILTLTVKKGKKAFIVAYRQAWDGALDPNLYHTLLINGQAYHKFARSRVQFAAPEQDVFLPVPIPVEQGAIVSMRADNEDTDSGNVTGRIIIYYYDP